MNWTEMLGQLQGQGSIYWIAAASIAAGATLLLVSGFIMARRSVMRGIFFRMGQTGVRRKGHKSGPEIEITESGYKASHLAPSQSVSGTANPDSRDLDDLQARLNKAANALDNLRQFMDSPNQHGKISDLKPSGQDVEYVFKAGIG